MGVIKFYKWLSESKVPNVIQDWSQFPNVVSSFSFDLNGLLHRCAQLVWAYGSDFKPDENPDHKARLQYVMETPQEKLEEEFLKVLETKIITILNLVRPREVLILAVDGVAPEAKMSQQRQRRYKAALERTSDSTPFDSNCLTPGTDFMRKIDKHITQWIHEKQFAILGSDPLFPQPSSIPLIWFRVKVNIK